MKKKLPLIILLAAAAVLLAITLLPKGESVPYTLFREELRADNVDSVTFESGKLNYRTKSGGRFSTSDPSSPTLREELLLAGVSVSDGGNDLESLTNTVFNTVFLAAIFFGLWKIFSWYRSTFRTVRHTGVRFSDIAGMDGLKRDMAYAVGVLKGEIKTQGQRSLKGIILEGPPGNGKTLFARALAEEAGVRFIASKGADFQGAVMGLGAMKVKMLFSKAKKKKPCIIFIDEFDSIGEKRNYAGSGIDKENNRILTTLLNEMDGFEKESGILVIAATNSYSSLDPALIRPGRFDLKYTVSNPDVDTRRKLVEIYSRGKNLDSTLTPELLSSVFAGLSAAAIESVLNESLTVAMQRGLDSVTMECIVEASLRCQEKLNIKIRKN